MVGQFLVIAILILSAWGCLALIGGPHGIVIKPIHPYHAYAVWNAGPIIMIVFAAIAWAKARSWRRMAEIRAASAGGAETLARGGHQVQVQKRGPSGLERISAFLLLLGLIALPYWLLVAAPGLWAGAIVVLWVVICRGAIQ